VVARFLPRSHKPSSVHPPVPQRVRAPGATALRATSRLPSSPGCSRDHRRPGIRCRMTSLQPAHPLALGVGDPAARVPPAKVQIHKREVRPVEVVRPLQVAVATVPGYRVASAMPDRPVARGPGSCDPVLSIEPGRSRPRPDREGALVGDRQDASRPHLVYVSMYSSRSKGPSRTRPEVGAGHHS